MITSESTSRIELSNPTSLMNKATRLAAKNSSKAIDEGFGIFSDNQAITSPLEFLMTTPIPASPVSAKTAPLKFVVKQSVSGGFHFMHL